MTRSWRRSRLRTRDPDRTAGTGVNAAGIATRCGMRRFASPMSADAMTINLVSMNAGDTRAVAEWLVDGARSAAQPQQVMAQLCDRLLCCGIPLWRAAVSVSTLHPQIVARRFIWRPGAEVEVSEGRFGLFDTPDFRDSPVAHVIATGETLRRRLADPACPLDFPILLERRAEGATDYLATPLFFTDGTIHLATWTSRQPGGLSDLQIAGIEAIVAPLARVAEIWATRRTAGTRHLCRAPRRGAYPRGQIRRGDIEEIHAAIWLSDMRGFTTWSDSIPPRLLIDLLNRYFDCQVPAILDHDGEVLKFMGDGLLAIFPIAGGDGNAAEACRRALAAARTAQANVEALAEPAGIEHFDGD